jgi:hypothetical protein
MTKASDSAEPFGSEFLDTAQNPEFIEGLKAEGLVAGRQSLRKDPINIVYLRVVFTIIGTHFPDEPNVIFSGQELLSMSEAKPYYLK